MRRGKRFGSRRAHSSRRSHRPESSERTAARLARKRRTAQLPRQRRQGTLPHQTAGVQTARYPLLPKPRQLCRQPRPADPLAGRTSGKPRHRNLSRLCRHRNPVSRRRLGQRHRHRQHGRGQRRRSHRNVSSRHRTARQTNPVCRRLPRLVEQTAYPPFRIG